MQGRKEDRVREGCTGRERCGGRYEKRELFKESCEEQEVGRRGDKGRERMGRLGRGGIRGGEG